MRRWVGGAMVATMVISVGCGEASTTPEVVVAPTPSLDITPPVPDGAPPRIGTHAIELVDVTTAVGADTPAGFSVAFVDYNDDGWPDLTVGTELGLMILENQRDGTFANVTLRAKTQYVGVVDTTVYADVNGDGHLDLYVGRREGHDELLQNDGAGHLAPFEAAGIPESRGIRGVSFGDVDRDGDLDLFVCIGRQPEFGYGDTGDGGGPDVLLLNDGAGHFSPSEQAVSGPDNGETFAATLVDFDRDGWQDLMVVTASASDYFYRGGPGGIFVDQTQTTTTDRWTNLMGLSVGDLNGDLRLDVFGTDSIHDTLYYQRGDGSFEQVIPKVLPGSDPTAVRTGWGVAIADLDQDGDQDIIEALARDEFFRGDTQPRPGGFLVLENNGHGIFKDITYESGEATGQDEDGKGLSVADYDRDGDLDVAVMTPGAELGGSGRGLRLLRNDGARAAGNGALLLDLRWEGNANSRAVGAIVDVVAGPHRTSRAVTAGSSYLSAVDFVQHFGLGDEATAQVTVTWPDAQVDVLDGVTPGHYRLRRAGDAVSLEPAKAPTMKAPLDLPCDATCRYCQAICSLFDQCGALEESGVSTVFDCVVQCWLARPPVVEACLGDIACSALQGCAP